MTRRQALAALVVVTCVGLALRLWAFAGISGDYLADDSRYVAVAQNLAHGYAPDGDGEWFGGRVAFLWPVAALFRMWGAGDLTAVAWPLAASLLAIVATYLVAWELTGRRRLAVTAAALVAAAPLEVLVATRLRPDAVMPAFIALSVWAALRSRRGHHPLAWAAAAGLLWGAAWSAREMAVVMAPVVLLAAGRPAWPRLVAGVGGAVGAVAAACAAVGLAGASFLMPLTGTAGATQTRAPWDAWTWDSSYLAWAVTHASETGHPAMGAAAVVGLAVVLLASWRPRCAALPAIWAGWGLVYLEVVALTNLTPSPRFLTLIVVPTAILVAIAADRVAPWGNTIAIGAAVCAAALAAHPVATREDRRDNVDRVRHLVAWFRARGVTQVLSEDHTTHAKLNLFLARDRIDVPVARDPRFDGADAAVRPPAALPDPASMLKGYLVLVSPRPQAGQPPNWSSFRADMRSFYLRSQLTPVGQVDDAQIYRWGP